MSKSEWVYKINGVVFILIPQCSAYEYSYQAQQSHNDDPLERNTQLVSVKFPSPGMTLSAGLPCFVYSRRLSVSNDLRLDAARYDFMTVYEYL